MQFLNNLLDDGKTKLGRAFAYLIQILIVISLITFSISTLPDNSPEVQIALHLIEIITVLIFSFEYIGRIIIAREKMKFIFSFFGLVDLLAILPFYLSIGLDLRAIRAFRLFRLVRILKLLKYSDALRRFHQALIIIKEELILFSFFSAIVLYLSAVGIYYFEHVAQPDRFKSIFHSLWWAVTTLTTVGYGDMYPVTFGGRLFTFCVLIIGLGIVAVPTGLISSALSRVREEERRAE